MASSSSSTAAYNFSCMRNEYLLMLVLCIVLILDWGSQSCNGFGDKFGFDIHHRFSDPVKQIMGVHHLPEKGTPEYYAAMAHRDRFIHGRKLASTVDQTNLIFRDGNETFRISSLGFLHYANVSVGSPSLSFLVALDTGSDLFWLPCDCTSCVHDLETASGDKIKLNIYSPNASSTSTTVPCNNSLCQQQKHCSATDSSCPYQVLYLSQNTSSTGILVEDVLQLTTDNDQLKDVDAPITFGCGQVQTGSFLDGAAPNGLFGLGMEDVSVPSILAAKGLTSSSFSMCFGPDGIGRITFGDKGSSDQGETPFNIRRLHPTYNISINQISVGEKTTDLNFSAIFDTGTSFTYLNDPVYTAITESFNSQAQDKRHAANSRIPFEFCYDISPNQTNLTIPSLTLTMEGGHPFNVSDPLVFFSLQSNEYIYCLGVVKSEDVDIIGQNFMTGYRIVFDRDRMVLGWKASNCYDKEESSTLPTNPGNTTAVPPSVAVTPQDTAGPSNGLDNSGAPQPPKSDSSRLSHLTCAFIMMIFFPLFFGIV